MFSSLRTRLLLTYIALVIVILFVTAITITLYLIRNPVVYRQEINQIRLAANLINQRLKNAPDPNINLLEQLITRTAEITQTRILIVDPTGQLIFDSMVSIVPSLILPGNLQPRIPVEQSAIRSMKDSNNQVWLYSVQIPPENNPFHDYRILVTKERPQFTVRNLLRDELIAPLLKAAVISIILAFLMAWFMSQSIGAPLRQLTSAARGVATGMYHTIPVQGPSEVKTLAKAFNEMTRQVQSSQQAQKDLIANVSHELKTPLTSIQGFAQAILDGTAEDPDNLRQAVQIIYDESGRMNRLVLDLLTLARLEGGTANLKRSPVDLVMILRNVVEKFSPQAKNAGITLSYHEIPLPPIIGDSDRLAQVLTNLVDNAIKFTPAGGQVILTTHHTDQSVEICVADTGPGLSIEEQNRVFERFYQTDKSRQKTSKPGVGLGLAIARQIINAHAGKIWVESAPGHGARFFIRLPLTSSSDDAPVPQKKS